MAKNLILGPILAYFCPLMLYLLLVIAIHCSKLSSYAIYRKTNESNLGKWQKKKKKKKKIEPDFGSFSRNLSPKIFFRNFDHY